MEIYWNCEIVERKIDVSRISQELQMIKTAFFSKQGLFCMFSTEKMAQNRNMTVSRS